jgi:hypothetical protein
MSIARNHRDANAKPVQYHGETFGWNLPALACPGCGGYNIHFDLDHVENTDSYTCPLGTRGSWVSLAFWCEECPHRWSLIAGFHKGMTFLGTVDRPDLPVRDTWDFPF